MTIVAHGSGLDDLLMVAVPIVFIVVYRLVRGREPPDDDTSGTEPPAR